MAKLSDKQKETLIAMSIEVDDNDKPKYTQQELADKFDISKGMVNRYVKKKKDISKQIIDDEVRILRELKSLEKEKSKHLSKQEQIEVNKRVRSELDKKEITENITLSFQEQIQKRQNVLNKLIDKVEELFYSQLDECETEEDVQKLYDSYNTKMEMLVNYKEIREGIEANDKASLTLGVNSRHAKQGDVNVNATAAVQNNQVNKEVVKEALEEFENEY